MSHYCKHCQLTILPDIRNEEANDHGFCTKICEKLYYQEKEYQMQRAERGQGE